MRLQGQLIVSCQALPHEPLHSDYIMAPPPGGGPGRGG